MEPKLSYGKRLNRASWREYGKFWSGYRLLATFGGLLAPLLVQLQKGVHSMLSLAEAVESGAFGLIVSLTGTYLFSRRKGAEALDAQLHEELDKVNRAAELGKHSRTNAEQYRYDKAKAAVTEIQEQGVLMLQHLQTHGPIKFNGLIPPLPHGMGKSDAIAILQKCVTLDLVTSETTSRPSGGTAPIVETVFRISPGMQSILDEVLYPASG